MTTAERNDWGPYRCTVADRLAACEDYLGRLRRSLAGEIAPDRHYFAEKAVALRDAAQTLVEGTEDVEWWLGACTHEVAVESSEEGSESFAECGHAAGHLGPHQDEDRCPEQLRTGRDAPCRPCPPARHRSPGLGPAERSGRRWRHRRRSPRPGAESGEGRGHPCRVCRHRPRHAQRYGATDDRARRTHHRHRIARRRRRGTSWAGRGPALRRPWLAGAAGGRHGRGRLHLRARAATVRPSTL